MSLSHSFALVSDWYGEGAVPPKMRPFGRDMGLEIILHCFESVSFRIKIFDSVTY